MVLNQIEVKSYERSLIKPSVSETIKKQLIDNIIKFLQELGQLMFYVNAVVRIL